MPQTRIAHYDVLDLIGKGGMGEVYRARDSRLRREVALKVLPEQFTREADRLARFEREAQLLAALNHPGIAAIYGLERDGATQVLVMELVEGRDLGDRLVEGALPLDEVVSLTEQLAEALAYAHGKGIVHRDLKPANIRLTVEGRSKILDFGLARAYEGGAEPAEALEHSDTLESPITRMNMVLGTPRYMSPEQATGSPHIDHRSDIYSLGCVVYEMLTGKAPYEGPDAQSLMSSHAIARIPQARDQRPELPGGVQKVLDRALAKSPEDRYTSALEFAGDLRLALLGKPKAMGRSRVLLGAAALAIVIGALGGALWSSQRGARQQAWIHGTAIPGIDSLAADGDYEAAFELANEILAVDPDNEALVGIIDSFSREVDIRSEPPGATVSRRPLESAEEDWQVIGTTPLTVRIPSQFQRFRFEKEGYTTSEIASHWYYLKDQVTRMGREGEFPEDMIYVPGGETALNIPGLDHLAQIDLGSYLLGRFEVTNEEYARFVEAGGYEKPEYWTEAFTEGGRSVSFQDAVARFTDRTGRPGPSTWEAGDFPEGRGEHPVGGISWFEAMAYARFVDRSIPTIYHWNRAAETRVSNIVVPHSNFDGKGTAPVGEYPSMTAFGVRDMAGNVREWCSNATGGGERVILGGGWNDLPYMFNDFYAQSPWDRGETNGCRTMVALDPIDPRVNEPVEPPFRDFFAEARVSDEIFAVYRNLFSYDKGNLDPRVLMTDDTPEDYVAQKVEFNAAYGGERMTAYFYAPKGSSPPWPAVVYFPGSNAIHTENSDALTRPWFRWLMKQGYAVIHPIYKGTYERGTELDSDYPDETQSYLDHVVMWGKDLSRSIDYLESRGDVDVNRLGYFGASWGGAMGSIMLAIEPRFEAGVLFVAGLLFQNSRPEADAINYVSHVTVPVLMLNGKYDHFFPVETAQKPMFELLGTPAEHKRHYLYEGGHSVPRPDVIRESLAWFDKYLAPSGT